MVEEERTCYVSGFDQRVTDELIEELFTQVGPLVKVTMVDKGAGHRFALVVFTDEESVPFAIETMDGVKLFNVPITVKPRNGTEQEKLYKRNSGTPRSLSQSYTPSHMDDRKRDHSGMRPMREDNWRQAHLPPTPMGAPLLNISSGNFLPPPPMMPMLGGFNGGSNPGAFFTPPPPPPRVQPGYKVPPRSASGDFNRGGGGPPTWDNKGREPRYDQRTPQRNQDDGRQNDRGGYWATPTTSRSSSGGSGRYSDDRDTRYDRGDHRSSNESLERRRTFPDKRERNESGGSRDMRSYDRNDRNRSDYRDDRDRRRY